MFIYYFINNGILNLKFKRRYVLANVKANKKIFLYTQRLHLAILILVEMMAHVVRPKTTWTSHVNVSLVISGKAASKTVSVLIQHGIETLLYVTL